MKIAKVNLVSKDPLSSIILTEDFDLILNHMGENFGIEEGSNFLITGSSGMIASYFVLFLVYLIEKKNRRFKLFLTTTNVNRLKEKLGKYFFSDYIEIIDNSLIKEISLNFDFDYVLHAASLASPHHYRTTPVNVIEPNIIGTYNLLSNLVRNQIQIKCMLFLSSFSVYGNSAKVIDETSSTNLNHFDERHYYGSSKIAGELIMKTFYQQYGIPIKIARLAHSFGPGLDFENDSRIFSSLIGNLIENKPLTIRSPKSSRSFTYLSDIITGFLMIMLNKDNDFVFNLSNPYNVISNIDLVKLLSAHFGNEIQIQNSFGDIYVNSEVVAFPVFNIDTTAKLGWNPSVTVLDAFIRTINYLREIEKNDNQIK